MDLPLKDELLAGISRTQNVANFVSFGPDVAAGARFSILESAPTNARGSDLSTAICDVFARSSGTVNVRSFRPGEPSGNPFYYGLTSSDDVLNLIVDLASRGYYTIVNETIDVNDGGVSGVLHGGLIEFAVGATPRAVETAEHTSMPTSVGLLLLERIYGADLEKIAVPGKRTEFSVHPLRVGVRREHALVWELMEMPTNHQDGDLWWPNQFSAYMGDKAFGLLVAELLGFSVPLATVFSRRIAPFRLGRATGTNETWIRTVPTTRTPGLFTTRRGWCDPFALLSVEDPTGECIAAVLAQEGVDAKYSGAAVTLTGGRLPLIEGVPGFGDDFMQGSQLPAPLPRRIMRDVKETWRGLRKRIAAPSFEWVHDGHEVWIVQLHADRSLDSETVITPGEPTNGWLDFQSVGNDLSALRVALHEAITRGQGVNVIGRVGLTSHIGDLLRGAGIPAKITVDHE